MSRESDLNVIRINLEALGDDYHLNDATGENDTVFRGLVTRAADTAETGRVMLSTAESVMDLADLYEETIQIGDVFTRLDDGAKWEVTTKPYYDDRGRIQFEVIPSVE